MAWRYRKTKRVGPFRFTLTHRGLTTSVGAGGFSHKISRAGRKKSSPSVRASSTGRGTSGFGFLIVCVIGLVFVCSAISTSRGKRSDEKSESTSARSVASSTIPPTLPAAAEETPSKPPIETVAATSNISKVEQPQKPPIAQATPINNEPPSLLPIRSWMSRGGKYSTQARLLIAVGELAYLQKEDGNKIVEVPINKLSSVDEDYVSSERSEDVIVGTITGVHEGDLITVKDGTVNRIRLDGIDAPEKKQKFFEESRKALKDKVFQKEVRIEYTNKDKDSVISGNVIADGHWINKEMVSEGYAWQRGNNPVLVAEEAKAKAAKLGLWADVDAIPPWEFQSQPKIEVAQSQPASDETSSSKSVNSSPAQYNSFLGPSDYSSSRRSSSSRSSEQKTEYVSDYTRKDGTHVNSYMRRSGH